jgi:hypothetical protein
MPPLLSTARLFLLHSLLGIGLSADGCNDGIAQPVRTNSFLAASATYRAMASLSH